MVTNSVNATVGVEVELEVEWCQLTTFDLKKIVGGPTVKWFSD